MNNLPILVCILTFLVLGCTANNNSNTSTKTTLNLPIEEKIVAIDKGSLPDSNDIDVKRVRYLLNYISARCSNSRDEIAELANSSVQSIENNYGRKVARQQFLEASKELLDESLKDKKFPKNKDGKIEFGAIAGAIVLTIK